LPAALAAAASGCIVGDGITVNSLLFADDVVLIAKTPEDMQRLLDAATEHAAANHYLWNPTKSVVIDERAETSYTLIGARLEHVSSFPYMGMTCTADGINQTAQTQMRVTKATRTAHILRAIGMNTRGLHPYAASILWKTFGRASMEYGSAAYVMRVRDRKLCDNLQNQVHRWIFGGGRTAATQAMRTMTNTTATRYRNHELNARFLSRYSHADADRLSGHVWRTVMTRRPKGSVLRQGDSRNPLWKQLKAERRAQERTRPTANLDPTADISEERRRGWRTAETARCRGARRAELTRALSSQPEGDYWLKRWGRMRPCDRRLLLQWRLGHIPGRPMECSRCMVAGKQTTRKHVLECLGLSTERVDGRLIVDQLLVGAGSEPRRQQYESAMAILRRIEASWEWPRRWTQQGGRRRSGASDTAASAGEHHSGGDARRGDPDG
jgi:hypothetical protein